MWFASEFSILRSASAVFEEGSEATTVIFMADKIEVWLSPESGEGRWERIAVIPPKAKACNSV